MQTILKPDVVQILNDVLDQVRQEMNSICDSAGNPIQPNEIEGAIGHLLTITFRIVGFVMKSKSSWILCDLENNV